MMAVKAAVFLNSIGVNAAVSVRGEALEKTIELIRYTGIRWIRSGYEGGIPDADLIHAHLKTGVRFSYGFMGGGTDLARLLASAKKLAASDALLSLEG